MGVRLKVFGATDVGRVRSNNEDTFVVADLNRDSPTVLKEDIAEFDVREAGILMAVSDGMGGEQAGEVASALVVESLRRELAGDKKDKKVDGKERLAQIERAVTKANVEVWQAASAPDKAGMGATLTAVFVEGGAAHIAEVGDSRAYLIRSGRIRQMTRDQSFVQLLLESGVISESEAANYPHRNVILQAMGQRPEVTVAIGKLELRRGDVLILCSDGLSNKLQAEEMRELVAKHADLKLATKKMIELANDRGGEDNITIVAALAFGEDLPPPMRAETVTQTFEVLQDYAPPPSKPPPATNGDKPMVDTKDEKKEPAAEAKKEEPKKEEPKKEEPKKEEAKKEEPKKEEPKKEEPKKEEAKKEAPKKEEKDEDEDEDEEEEEEKPAAKKKVVEDEDEEEEEKEEIAAKKKDAPAKDGPPTQEQRIKEMLTLAAVFLGLGLLIYWIFKT
jgi:serine/threonine protein phosphatase PrpC